MDSSSPEAKLIYSWVGYLSAVKDLCLTMTPSGFDAQGDHRKCNAHLLEHLIAPQRLV